jgi:hypothetical protein
MPEPTTKTELLKAYLSELTKEYVELDAQSRPFRIYQADTDAVDGASCIVTEFEYLNATSSIVTKRRESYGTWVSATMDI